MKKFTFTHIVLMFVLLFFMLTFFYYKEARQTALDNVKVKIEDLLLNYQAFRTYVSKVQKPEIYRLQKKKLIDEDYFHPEVLSSTFSAKGVSFFYNELRVSQGLDPIVIRIASNNPRNVSNKASKEESEVLKRFNANEIKSFSKIVTVDGKSSLYVARPTIRTTKKCMKCHSDPKIAPQGLIDMYGDVNGFHEEVNKIRALLSISYPIDKDIAISKKRADFFTLITLFIFIILLIIVHRFLKDINSKKEKLEVLNKNLDIKVEQRTEELKVEKDHIQKILDRNPNIILLRNGTYILDVNARFLEFFDINELDDFTKDYDCICEFFVDFNNIEFSDDKTVEGIPWRSYLVDNQNKANTVTMKRDEKIHTFSINASILNDTGDILISLQDITELKEKEKLIVQQSKMASMGEMLTNIAHQWRQPLSMISTSATSVSMQQEYGILNDEKLNKSMDDINNSAQFLSKTIEDFRNFFDENKIYSEFEVKDILDKTLQILSGNFRNKAIEIKLEIDELKVFGLDSELMQVLINILNNARDIFEEKELNDKLILIKSYKDGNDIVISIHDNAGGIPENIIEKIFEPYFTTKHQSQGTGIGLYMSYDIITKNMSGKLKATNELINHNDSNRLGAKFEIIIPSNIK